MPLARVAARFSLLRPSFMGTSTPSSDTATVTALAGTRSWAGFRCFGIGALLGLAPWRLEALALARHGRALTLRFWRSRIAVSFPRIRSNAGGRSPAHPVSDRELVQMICAVRLALPDAELVLSTREPAVLRDRLMGIGITRMSAGSKTNPGGYGENGRSGEQFAIEDARSPSEVAAALLERGFEPVWKDFDRCFLPATSPPEVA
jgi:2-iminoacetate synthase